MKASSLPSAIAGADPGGLERVARPFPIFFVVQQVLSHCFIISSPKSLIIQNKETQSLFIVSVNAFQHAVNNTLHE